MKDNEKSKEQLIQELEELRRRNSGFLELEARFERSINNLLDCQKTFRALINSPNDSILMINRDGFILDANEFFARRLNRRLDEVIGFCIWDLLPPEVIEHRKTFTEQVFQSGRPFRFEDEGGGLWLDNVIYPVIDEHGEVAHVAVLARDITMRKDVLKALAASEEKYRQLFNVENDAIFLVDVESGRFMDANPAALKLYGYGREELLGMHHMEVSAEPEKSRTAVEGGERQVFHRLHRKKDGTIFPVEINGSYYHHQGELVHVAAIRDISERKRSEAAMQETLRQYHEEADRSQKLSQENKIMARIGRIIGSTLNIDEVYESFAGEVKKLIPFDGLAINIINQQAGLVSVPFVFGPEVAGCQKGEVFPLQGSVTGEVLRIRSGLISHFEDRREIKTRFPALFKGYEQGLRSVIVVPLISKDSAIGTMHIRSTTSHRYSTRELELAERVGLQISGAIENARIFKEWRLAVEDRRKGEERFRFLAENMADIVWVADANLHLSYIGPTVTSILGFTPEERGRQSLEEMYPPDCLMKIQHKFQEELGRDNRKGVDPDRSITIETECFRKDGSLADMEIKARAIRDENGAIIGIIGVSRDISQRKRAEAVLRESERRYRLIAENVNDVIWTMDLDFNFTYVSPSIFKLVGLTVQEALNKSISELFTPSSLQTALEAIDREREFRLQNPPEANRRITVELEEYRRDGSTLWTSNEITYLRDEDRTLIGYVGVSRDISEKKRIETAMRESEERFRSMIQSSSDIILILDDKGCLTYESPSFARILGYRPGQFIGRSPLPVVSSDDLDRVSQALTATFHFLNDGPPVEFRCRKADGSRVVLEAVGINQLDNPAINGIVLNIRDITQRKEAEDKLRKSEERYRLMIEEIEDGYYESDLDGNLTFFNDYLCRITKRSREELSGLNYRDYTDAENAEILLKSFSNIFRTGQPAQFEYQILRADGAKRYMESTVSLMRDASGKPAGFRGIATDITEKKQQEENRIIMDKLESTGLLAGGIAHDFNNLLGVILGNLGLITLPEEDPLGNIAFLEEAVRAVSEAKKLTNQFITLAKGGDPITQVISLSELLRDQATLVLRGSRIAAEFSIPEDLWTIKADEGQMGQVVRNILLNAREAMPEGGTITTVAENVHLDTPDSHIPKPGNYVKVTVSDQGQGVPPDSLQKIFDPYFSTKSRGSQRGMGLGLTICRSIIQKHGGAISITSTSGRGALVSFYLPAYQNGNERKPRPLDRTMEKTRVLVMDDEEGMRKMIGMILKRIGFEAEVVRTGEEAVEMYEGARNAERSFDLVILDLTVRGGMGGRETVRRLLEIDPEVKAIVASGYNQDPVMQNYRDYGFKGALIKPFFINELTEVLSGIIGSSSTV
jgi:PAS domain S-box-containing protein